MDYLWVKVAGDEPELLKERRKAFEEITASRIWSGDINPIHRRELLKKSIADLLCEAKPKDEYERHYLLHRWLYLLNTERKIQDCTFEKLKDVTVTEREKYDDKMDAIRCKEKEIHQHLEDSPPAENAATTPTLEYGEPELLLNDAIGLYPALKLLSDDWTAEELALQVFYGGIRAFEKSDTAGMLMPVANIQDWLIQHGKAEAFSGELYSIKKALLKFNYSKSELSQFKPEYRYISYQQAIVRISELVGNIEDAEEFLIDAIDEHEIVAFHPFVGTITPELSLDDERWRNGYFVEWLLNRLLKSKYDKIETPKETQTKYQQRDDDFKLWIKETKPDLDAMTKAKIQEQLIPRDGHLWRSGFDDWWKKQDIHKGTPGRKPV